MYLEFAPLVINAFSCPHRALDEVENGGMGEAEELGPLGIGGEVPDVRLPVDLLQEHPVAIVGRSAHYR